MHLKRLRIKIGNAKTGNRRQTGKAQDRMREADSDYDYNAKRDRCDGQGREKD
jgi:hypothetical protein